MPRYLDLFAGAGGLSEGFIRAGYSPVAHVEMDEAACYTLKTRAAYRWLKEKDKLFLYNDYLNGDIQRNDFYNLIPKQILDTVLNYEISQETLTRIFDDINLLLGEETLDLIIGGPPCQAYSIAGRSRSATRMLGDKRNFLYVLYAEFLKRYQPKFFVFENVVGILSAKDIDGTRHFDNLQQLFKQCGYAMDYRILNASDYGVLQHRKRVILIGSKIDLSEQYPDIPKIEKVSTVNDLFNDLPEIKAGEGTIRPVGLISNTGKYLYETGIKDKRIKKVTFHQARPHSKQDLEIYRLVVEAWNLNRKRITYGEIPERLRTHKNTKSFLDRFKVVAGELSYAQTIVAHIAKDGHYFIHPDINQNRSLTPREVARIQTFPDDYFFESKKGQPSRTIAFKQIGNAVPICLAYCIAKALLPRFKQ